MRYLKRPFPIEAVQINPVFVDNYTTIREAMNAMFSEMPVWLEEALDSGKVGLRGYIGYSVDVVVSTLEGDMGCGVGDYIIRGVEGELYPCRKHIFEKTYEEEPYFIREDRLRITNLLITKYKLSEMTDDGKGHEQ